MSGSQFFSLNAMKSLQVFTCFLAAQAVAAFLPTAPLSWYALLSPGDAPGAFSKHWSAPVVLNALEKNFGEIDNDLISSPLPAVKDIKVKPSTQHAPFYSWKKRYSYP